MSRLTIKRLFIEVEIKNNGKTILFSAESPLRMDLMLVENFR